MRCCDKHLVFLLVASLVLLACPAWAQDEAPLADSGGQDAAPTVSGFFPDAMPDRPLSPDIVLPLVEKHPELAHEFMPLLLPADPDQPREWSCLGCHEAQVAPQAWFASVHKQRAVTCLHCHPEGADVPHEGEVSAVHCGTCHAGTDEMVAAAEASAHGPNGPGAANGCGGCHDPHVMGDEGADAAHMAEAGCLECHDEAEDLADRHADFLCAADLHLAVVGCQYCHIQGNDSEAVHDVKFGEAADIACTDCHGGDSMLALAGELDEDGLGLLKVNNNALIRETGYLIGANRILGLDILMVLMVLGAMCFPVVHGGLRVLFGRAR